MSVMGRIFEVMGLQDDDDYEDDYYEDDGFDSYEEEKPRKSRRKDKSELAEEKTKSTAGKDRSSKSGSKITPMYPSKKKGNNMEVCVFKPNLIDDAREIIDTLLEDHAVILNMEGLNAEVAQQIVNCIYGACYAMNGSLQKVSSFIFLATPASVEISGDLQGFVDAFDLSGIQNTII